MRSWSLATDSRPLGTWISLTDTKRRRQKHCFKHCLPGLLVSNSAKWIKLSPIKYLTILFPPRLFYFLSLQFHDTKTVLRQEEYFVMFAQILLKCICGMQQFCICFYYKERVTSLGQLNEQEIPSFLCFGDLSPSSAINRQSSDPDVSWKLTLHKCNVSRAPLTPNT